MKLLFSLCLTLLSHISCHPSIPPSLSLLAESSAIPPVSFSSSLCHSGWSDSYDNDSLGSTSIGRNFAGASNWLGWLATFCTVGEAMCLWPRGPEACLHLTHFLRPDEFDGWIVWISSFSVLSTAIFLFSPYQYRLLLSPIPPPQSRPQEPQGWLPSVDDIFLLPMTAKEQLI